jgi:nitrite reductase/ring-hydroxylating ferredoxin subunit/uncharacterized membrane protein
MAENTALQMIDRQDWLDPLADKVQEAVTQAYSSAGATGQKVENFLHGTWLGHPLHSAITDVPIGAWTSAMVMDAMEDMTGQEEFGFAADTAVAIGLAGAVAAAAAGITDWHKTDGAQRRVGLAHGLLNVGGVLLYSASLAARRNGSRSAGRGFSAIGFLTMLASSWLGGELVYGQKVGVDHTASREFPKDFVPVLAEGELAEGEMKRVDVEGEPVLLAKRDGRIHAMSNVCPHMGGPLNEGRFEGEAVQCPWHGSRFSIEDGRVLDGPAVHPAPRLEVRVQGGQIEVKRAGD